MKRSGPFKWTPEAAKAFEDLKKYLASPPIMVAPRPREPLKLYLAATPQTASAVLVVEREEPVLAKKSSASPSPEPPDKEAASPSLEPQVEPMQTEQVLPEGLPQENLDKASTEPREEPNAATRCPIKRGNVLENFPVLRCMSTANKNIHLFEQQSALNGRKAKDTI